MLWLCTDWDTDWTAIGSVLTGIGAIATAGTVIAAVAFELWRRGELALQQSRRAFSIAHALNIEMLQIAFTCKNTESDSDEQALTAITTLPSEVAGHALGMLTDFDLATAERIAAVFAATRLVRSSADAAGKGHLGIGALRDRACVLRGAATTLRRALLPYRNEYFRVAERGRWDGHHPLAALRGSLRTPRRRKVAQVFFREHNKGYPRER